MSASYILQVLLHFLLHVTAMRALPTEAADLHTVDNGTLDLKSNGFPSTPTPSTQSYYIRCVPRDQKPCYFRILFTDLDLVPGSQMNISEPDMTEPTMMQRTIFTYIQPHITNTAMPVLSSTSGIIIIRVSMKPLEETPVLMRYAGFRVIFTYTEVAGLSSWINNPNYQGCPKFRQEQMDKVRMGPPLIGNLYTEKLSDDMRTMTNDTCTIVLKGWQNCPVYINILSMSGYSIIARRGISSQAPVLQEVNIHFPFAMSDTGLYIQLTAISSAPRRALSFNYGCYKRRPESFQNLLPCSIPGLLPRAGLSCGDNLCMYTDGKACDGQKDCPYGEDEDADTCPMQTVVDPESLRPVPTHHVGVVGKTDMRGPGGYMLYSVYTIIPLIILMLVGCVYYRMTLRARSIFGRPRAQMNFDPPPPPPYIMALTHPKPEIKPLSTLPSYEESQADRAPEYSETCIACFSPEGTTLPTLVGKEGTTEDPPTYVITDPVVSLEEATSMSSSPSLSKSTAA